MGRRPYGSGRGGRGLCSPRRTGRATAPGAAGAGGVGSTTNMPRQPCWLLRRAPLALLAPTPGRCPRSWLPCLIAARAAAPRRTTAQAPPAPTLKRPLGHPRPRPPDHGKGAVRKRTGRPRPLLTAPHRARYSFRAPRAREASAPRPTCRASPAGFCAGPLFAVLAPVPNRRSRCCPRRTTVQAPPAPTPDGRQATRAPWNRRSDDPCGRPGPVSPLCRPPLRSAPCARPPARSASPCDRPPPGQPPRPLAPGPASPRRPVRPLAPRSPAPRSPAPDTPRTSPCPPPAPPPDARPSGTPGTPCPAAARSPRPASGPSP